MQKKYMETLLAQIREKRARESVRQEVEGHIKEQKAYYMADGIPEEQAEEQAVADMGDPVETGSALDQIHRPKPAWGTLALIAALCVAGVMLQYAMYINHPADSTGSYYFERQCQHAVLGFLVLCGVYLIDYTRIAKYSRCLCIGILLLPFLAQSSLIPLQLYDTYHGFLYLNFFVCMVSVDIIFYLYLPLYGAVLYSYRNCSRRDLCGLFLYTILPICFAFRFAHLSASLNITVILLLMLGTAAAKGWLPIAAGRLPFIKSACVLLIGGMLFFALLYLPLASYQTARLQAWLDPSAFRAGAGYAYSVIRDILSASQLVGGHTGTAIHEYLPNYETDYILTYTIGTFGILAAAALVIPVVVLGAKLLYISFSQKNQLGMVMGLGCSLAFVMQSAEYILVNLTLLPTSSLYFPFLSYGGSGMLQTCILLGILLSIYRYENVSSDSMQDFVLRRKKCSKTEIKNI